MTPEHHKKPTCHTVPPVGVPNKKSFSVACKTSCASDGKDIDKKIMATGRQLGILKGKEARNKLL